MGIHNECLLGVNDFNLDEEEIWMVNAPSEMPVSELEGQVLSFSGSGTVSANDTVYETNASREKSSTLVVMRDEEGDNVAISLRSRGILNIFQSVDVPELDSMEITPPAFVAQPKNMERRHPLFGIEQPPSFGSHLSSAIKRKSLAENGSNDTYSKKKKKNC
ncbi:uncharacterized protein [Lepeophtheirus salmonis]|uniref:uncharacterized protein n=1 Tax=Lepeophtheirus salmonis TaxID=72036 RepID=UPI003AF395F5